MDEGSYFIINRGRQYGKTTTLSELEKHLKDEYIVLSLDFQEIGTEDFADASSFSKTFAKMLIEAFEIMETDHEEALKLLRDLAENPKQSSLKELFTNLSKMCAKAPKPIVLMIDEVDSASNNQVFVDFLAQLRGYYLARDKKPIFHSVILAGVYDIKNLKLKLRSDQEHKYNSPWNIAAKFNIDMNFSMEEIASMLQEYKNDRQIEMDVQQAAGCIYDYTSGYPYLVSAICKLLDEDLANDPRFTDMEKVWSERGVREAVKTILVPMSASDTNVHEKAGTSIGCTHAATQHGAYTLSAASAQSCCHRFSFHIFKQAPFFESMVRQLEEYPEMKQMLRSVLFLGKRISYNPDTPAIRLASMFGYIINSEGSIQVANRIFEMRLYNLFLSEEELSNVIYDRAQGNKSQFIQDNKLDMNMVVEKLN